MYTEQDYQKAIHEVWDQYQAEKGRLMKYERELRVKWQEKLRQKETDLRNDYQMEINARQNVISSLRRELHEKNNHTWESLGLFAVGVFLGLQLGLSL